MTERDIFFFLWNKKTNSILQLPDGQTNFTTRQAAIDAIKNYKYKAEYEPIPASKFSGKEKAGSKIDDFLRS